MPRSLNEVVTNIAAQLMAADVDNSAMISEEVLGELAHFLAIDVAFLRHNDHAIHATKLVAEWPVREFVPDPDPIGVVYFADADPVFAEAEHLREPLVIRPEPSTDEYQRRIEEGTTVPSTSMASVPLLNNEITTGTLGFIKYGDREWLPAELDALTTIATLFAQLQARIVAEAKLRHLADHDDLTGLYNRRALMDHLSGRLSTGSTGPVAVLFLDLDRLKAINDYLGHASGDRFLALFADRLRENVRDTAMIARLGGDEFVAVPHQPMSLDDATVLAEQLQESLRGRVKVNGETLNRTVSIGVATGIPGIHSAADLMRYVDQALLSAKATGGNRIAVFTQDLALKSDLHNDIELHLRGGMDNDALVVHYQPEVDLRTGRVVAVEALCRWIHPTRGLLLPDSFIPVAESSNLAAELGRVVLRSSCAHLRRWRSRGLAQDLVMRVNVSPVQLVAKGFADSVADTLAEFDIDVGSICLEITESVVFKDIEIALENITALKEVGVKVAVDDFGTGYSALSRLKSLPVDTLKIDQAFVRDLGHDSGDLAIVRAIVALTDAFDMEVVAEGLETDIAAQTLVRIGCFRAQGYLLSRPIDDQAMEKLLRHPYLGAPHPAASATHP